MGRIRIINQYEPEMEEIYYDEQNFQKRYILLSDNYTKAEKDYLTIIMPAAAGAILNFIGWSTRYPRVEQGGFLVGRYYYDEKKKRKICVVEFAFPAKEASGDVVSLHITHEDAAEMYRKLDALNKNYPESKKLQLVGWFHTHPNALDVFMSGVDQETQSQLFGDEKSIALVFNPNRKIWKSYRSGTHEDNRAELLIDQDLFEKYGKKRLLNQEFGFGGGKDDEN